jgi:hypothetical protein
MLLAGSAIPGGVNGILTTNVKILQRARNYAAEIGERCGRKQFVRITNFLGGAASFMA